MDDGTNDELRTVAEESGFARTSLHAEVIAFIEALAPRTEAMSVQSMGVSPEGRDIPLLVLSADGRFTPEAAHEAAERDGRPVVMILCNIHAGEVEGKEAALMLARDVTTGALGRLMAGATVVLVPNFNPDGNDRIDPEHRRMVSAELDGQYGPEEGVGTRYTAPSESGGGFNLNRDYMKHDAPESRLLSKAYGAWNPHVFVDSHTSNGSCHAYALTWDTSHVVPSYPREPVLYTRDTLLPAIGKSLEARTGLRTWFYGNFRDQDDPESGWETYPGLPRFGSHYRGLTGRLDILLEAYSYAPFDERVRVTYEIFVEILDFAAQHGREIVDLLARSDADIIARGRDPQPDDWVGINYGIASRKAGGEIHYDYPAYPLREAEIAAWDLESMKVKRHRGGELTTWKNTFFCRFVPEISVRRPRGYVIPADRTDLIEHLRAHNVEVRSADAGATRVEQYRVLKVETTHSPDVGYEPRRETVLHVAKEAETLDVTADDLLVPMSQRLAHVAIYLLEPQSDDGMARWGWFDDLQPGDVYPVRRIPARAGIAPPPGLTPRRKSER